MKDISNNVTRYYFGDLTLDVQRGILTRSSEVISLPKLSYDLLLALVSASPTLLTQQELMSKVWPNIVIGDETLKQRVKLLRRSLADNASSPTYIEAVRGRGYRLIPEVTLEHIISRPSSVMVDLTANDRFPNLSSQQFSGLWQLVSKVSFIILFCFIIIFTVIFYNSGEVTERFDDFKVAVAGKLLAIIDDKKEPLSKQKIALDYYQKGLAYYKRYRAIDNTIAIDFFHKSINTLDDFSLAYAGLSQAYSQEIFQFDGKASSKTKAINNAYQAIAYDSQSAESYKALGTAYYVTGWLSKSIEPYLNSLKLSPRDNDTAANLGFIYSEQGKLVKAIAWNEKVLSRDNKHVVGMVHAGQTLQRLGYISLAEKWYKKAIEQQPDYLLATYYLGLLHSSLGRYDLAEQTFSQALALYQNHALLQEGLALTYYYSGDINKAVDIYQNFDIGESNQLFSSLKVMKALLSPVVKLAEIDQLITIIESELKAGSDKPAHSYYLAILYAYKKDEKRVMRYLIQSVEQGWMSVSEIINHPLLTQFQQSQAFKQIIAKIKIRREKANKLINNKIDYWRKPH